MTDSIRKMRRGHVECWALKVQLQSFIKKPDSTKVTGPYGSEISIVRGMKNLWSNVLHQNGDQLGSVSIWKMWELNVLRQNKGKMTGFKLNIEFIILTFLSLLYALLLLLYLG